MRPYGSILPRTNEVSEQRGASGRLVLLFTAALAGLLAPARASAFACVWTGGTSTNWATAGNWNSCNGTTPQSADTVTVNGGGNQPNIGAGTTPTVFTLTLNAGAVLTVGSGGSLTLGDGLAGAGSLNVSSGGALSWTAGTISGSATIASGGSLSIANFGATGLTGTLTNNGTATWTSGRIDFSGTGTFNNAGTMTTSTDNGCENFGGTPAFNNTGTFTKSAAGGLTYFHVPFHNTGTVSATIGTVSFTGGGTSSGSFSATAPGALNFGGGTHSITLGAANSISGTGTVGYSAGTVTIGGSGTYTVTGTSDLSGADLHMNIPAAAGSWTHSGGTLGGSGLVTVPSGKSYSWTGGTIAGSLTIALGGSLSIANSGATGLTGTLTNNGTATWTSGRIDFSGTGTFNNAGTMTTSTDNGCENFGGTPAFHNSGTFTKSTAVGLTYFHVPFHNTGTVSAPIGTVTLDGGGTSTGSYSATSPGTLNFGGGTHSITLAAASSISGTGTVGYSAGTVTVGGSGTYNVTGTSNLSGADLHVNLPSAASSWTHSAGTLGGSGTVTVPSGKSYSWTGGAIAGSVTIALGGTLSIANSGASNLTGTVTNNGTATWTSGRIDFSGTGTFNNAGTMTTTADNGCENFGGTPAFHNSGTFTKSTAVGLTYFHIPFDNTGTVSAPVGTISLDAGGTSTGTFSATGPGTVDFGGGTHAITLGGANSISGTGTIGYSSGTITIGGSGTYSLTGTSSLPGSATLNLNIPASAGSWSHAGGTLAGSGLVTVPSGKSYSWTGGGIASSVTIAAGATLSLANAGAATLTGTLTNNGTGTWSSGRIDCSGTATFNNAGTLTATTDNGFENFGGTPAFHNSGTFTKSSTVGTTYFHVPFDNTGTLNANSGTIDWNATFTQTAGATHLAGGNLSSSGPVLAFQGGTLDGTGTITANVTATAGAVVSPGSSAGTLTITGNYTQSSPAAFNAEIGGTGAGQFDKIAVGTAATIGGILNVSLLSYSPVQGDTFQLIPYGSHVGTYGTYNLPGLAGGLSWVPRYGATAFSLRVQALLPDLPMRVDVHAASAGTHNLNGVLDPGERVLVEPTWKNPSFNPITFTGAVSNFAGPAIATYTISKSNASYGTLSTNQSNNCFSATGNCYELSVDNPASRPAAHWDATLDETASNGDLASWTIHIGASFVDVAQNAPQYRFVETLFHNLITGGCGAGAYCPATTVTRAQMAVFLLKANFGASYLPPPATGTVFADVPLALATAPFIENLAALNVTGGCGNGNYCPAADATRAQMAVFLLKTEGGPSYTPPPCVTPTFGDVPCASGFAPWIEELVRRGITAGCGNGNYCPASPVTRGQMAVFLTTTFGLILNGP